MGVSALQIAIENAFDAAWSTTSVRYDNTPFEIPDQTSWVSIEIWPGKANKASAGSGTQLRRRIGTVFVNVYAPLNGGNKPAADLADSIESVFRDLTVSGITFYEPYTNRIGEKYYSNSGTGVTTSSQWYQMVVAIPFKYDVYA